MANPRPEEKQSETRQERGGTQTGSARENIRAISDVGSQIAGSAADMSKRAAQTGVEMLDRNKETAQQIWEQSTELFAHLARQSTEQMGRVLGVSGDTAEDGAKRTSRSFDALLQSGDVMRSASSDLSRVLRHNASCDRCDRWSLGRTHELPNSERLVRYAA